MSLPWGIGPQSPTILGKAFTPCEDVELPWYTLPGACSWMVDPRWSRVSSFGARAGTWVPDGGLLVWGKDPWQVVDRSTFLGLTLEPLGGEGSLPLWAMLCWEWNQVTCHPYSQMGLAYDLLEAPHWAPEGEHKHLPRAQWPWVLGNVQWLCFNNLGYMASRGFTHNGPTWRRYLWLDNISLWFGLNSLIQGLCRGAMGGLGIGWF